MDFQRRLIAASGLGDATHLPLGITGSSPPEVTMQRARDEVLMVGFNFVTRCVYMIGFHWLL